MIDDYWANLLYAMSEGDPLKSKEFGKMKITEFLRFKELWTEINIKKSG